MAETDPKSPTPTPAPTLPGDVADAGVDQHTAGTVATEAAAAPADAGFLDFFDPNGVPWALGAVVSAFVITRVLNGALARVSARFSEKRLYIMQVGTFVSFGIYGLAVVVAGVLLFDFSSEALLALSGGAAVTLGFAFKDVAASFLASITVLATKPFQVGDRVTFAGYYGEVVEIGLRSVRIVTLDDNLVTVPSNRFLTDAVASANAGNLDCMVVIPFFIAATADHDNAKEIVRDALLASRYLHVGKPTVVLVSNRVGEQGLAYIELTAKAYVYDAMHERAFASDVTEQALDALRKAGIAPAGAPET